MTQVGDVYAGGGLGQPDPKTPLGMLGEGGKSVLSKARPDKPLVPKNTSDCTVQWTQD